MHRGRTIKAVTALSGACALLLTACSGTGGGASGTDGNGELTLRFGHVYEPTHAVEACGVPALQSALEGSGVQVESFPSSQLGSEAEMLEQVSTGSLDMATAGAAFLGSWYEPAGVLDAGYLFDDVDHFTRALGSDTLANVFEELHSASGMRVQTGFYYGTRQVTSNVAVSSPDDIAGLKIRTPDAPIYLKNIGLMGGTATPMDLSEVYMALQQGVVDAQENPVPTIASSKFNEVQDYVNLTNHMVQGAYTVSTDALTEQMTAEQQEAFSGALQEFSDAVTNCVVEQEQKTLEEWEADGSITVNRDVDTEAFAREAQREFENDPVYGELYTEIRGL